MVLLESFPVLFYIDDENKLLPNKNMGVVFQLLELRNALEVEYISEETAYIFYDVICSKNFFEHIRNKNDIYINYLHKNYKVQILVAPKVHRVYKNSYGISFKGMVMKEIYDLVIPPLDLQNTILAEKFVLEDKIKRKFNKQNFSLYRLNYVQNKLIFTENPSFYI